MSLLHEAERAEDVADAFSTFRTPVPEFATDIAALVAELFAISAALRKIDEAVLSVDYGHNYPLIQDDLDYARSELRFTLDAVLRIMGEIGRGREITRDSYGQTWKDIYMFFRTNGQPSLLSRLQRYNRFICELGSIIRRKPYETRLISDLRYNFRDVYNRQDRQLTDAVAGMSLGPIVPITKSRSWDRSRPPSSPTDSRDDPPPYVPDVPSSTSATSTSQISSTEPEVEHWAKRVFNDLSATPLPKTGDISGCYGENSPDARDWLDEYDELFEITFGGVRELIVRLHVRAEDHRARILCKTLGLRGWRYCVLPLNTLCFHRVDSSLQLHRKRTGSSKTEVWATLKFTTIQRLVVFFCTLIALRSYDNGKLVDSIQDFELKGEVEIFGGRIVDDNFLHALRVYIDEDSGAIRLQASVLRGELKNTPIWTAFVTHSIASPTWCWRDGPKLIYLRELHRTIFSPEYTPHTNARGEHILKFMSTDDATGFLRTIDDLVRQVRRSGP